MELLFILPQCLFTSSLASPFVALFTRHFVYSTERILAIFWSLFCSCVFSLLLSRLYIYNFKIHQHDTEWSTLLKGVKNIWEAITGPWQAGGQNDLKSRTCYLHSVKSPALLFMQPSLAKEPLWLTILIYFIYCMCLCFTCTLCFPSQGTCVICVTLYFDISHTLALGAIYQPSTQLLWQKPSCIYHVFLCKTNKYGQNLTLTKFLLNVSVCFVTRGRSVMSSASALTK